MCLKALQILQFNSGKHLVFPKSNKISSQAKKEKTQVANVVKCKADGMDKESALGFQAFPRGLASVVYF